MRAMTVVPGRKGTAGVRRWNSRRLRWLVLGHEGLGEVLEAPAGSGFERGDLVVGIVRPRDPVPCPACAEGQWDMCRNDRFVERGIVRAHGYGSERWRVEPEFAVSLPRKLGDLGVLLEPASVLSKALDQTERISDRAFFLGGRGLVCGAGPIGRLDTIGRNMRPRNGVAPPSCDGAGLQSRATKGLPGDRAQQRKHPRRIVIRLRLRRYSSGPNAAARQEALLGVLVEGRTAVLHVPGPAFSRFKLNASAATNTANATT